MNLPALLAVTDASGTTHLVTDEQMAAGRSAGRYLAVCKATVASASLLTPGSAHCQDCRRWRAGQ